MNNLGEFLQQQARKFKSFTFLEIKRGIRVERYTYTYVNALSKQVAAFLKAKGIKKGDRVIIWANNCPEWVICFLGCLRFGAVVVPVDIRSSADIAKKYVDQTQPKLFFISQAIKTKPPYKKTAYVLEHILKLVEQYDPMEDQHVSEDDLAEIIFTSGTTGFPKGAMITHKNILCAIDAFAKSFPITSDFKLLSVLPLSHIFEQIVGLFFPLSGGASIVYLTRINSVTIFKGITYHKITALLVVPRMLQLMLEKLHDQMRKQRMEEVFSTLLGISHFLPSLPLKRLLFLPLHNQLGGSLQFLVSGGAPIDKSYGSAWEDMGFLLYQGYGSTETTAVTTANLIGKEKITYAGKAAHQLEITLASDGEVLVKGPTVFPGYWKDRERTKHAFVNGWYKTGDIGKLDSDGWLYLLGREKFRIVLSDGNKVYPEDIERKLNSFPHVKDSCIIGIKSGDRKILHAVILTDFPKEIPALLTKLNQQVEPHQHISHFSIWPKKDFPRLKTLKIDRGTVEQAILSERKPYLKGDILNGKFRPKDGLISLVSQVSKIPPRQIKKDTNLSRDLHLDSLQRVELIAAIEENFDAIIQERNITSNTTVGELRKLIEQSEIIIERKRPTWPRWKSTVFFRAILQKTLLFPYQAFFTPLTVIGREKLKYVSDPAIFYFNHLGSLDAIILLRILSPERRKKTMIITAARNWRNPFYGFLHELSVNAYSFANEGQDLKESLDFTGEMVDKGYSLIIAPEGAISQDGRILPFRKGIGLLAVELGIDAIGIKIDPIYRKIFPDFAGDIRNLIPKRRQEITVKMTDPFQFPKEASYEEASKRLEHALREL